MADDSGRVLALESALADLQRSVTAHDFLLRALVTQLALSDPQAFRRLIEGFTVAGFYKPTDPASPMAGEVAHELTVLLEEIAGRVERR
ncbi:MAG: hypothetical protein ABW360_17220 [Phenylobacterium sp.]